MFSRLIQSIAGLPEEEEESSEGEQEGEAEEVHSGEEGEGSDGGHLTLGNVAGRREPQEEAEAGGGGGGWGNILGGTPFLPLLGLFNRQSEEGDGAEEGQGSARRRRQQQQQQEQHARGAPASPADGGSQAYPTLATASDRAGGGGGGVEEEAQAPLGDTTAPALLAPDPRQPCPELGEPSALLDDDDLRCLAAAVPPRHRQARWALAYSTARDGISLQTLLRNCRGRAPTLLVVRDMARHVFGAFCSEPWRVAPRYFGTGETFVFKLGRQRQAWYWWWKRMEESRNDFFMWGTPEAIAIGGAGGYALWLDAELTSGLSRTSLTFGNDSLASEEEFRVGSVEVWWLQ